MNFKNSIYSRIFQGNGSLYEISLMLNLFKKYNGIYNIMKIIKTQKVISFDLIKIIKKSTLYLLKSFQNSNIILKEKNSFFNNIFKKFLAFVVYFLFKQKLPKNLKILFLSELNKKKYLKKTLSFYSFYGKKIRNTSFLTNNLKKNKKFLFNNKYYNFNLLKPIKTFLKTFRNKNNNNIFVTGEIFDFYEGSITPFSKSNFSVLVSTGLKADIECNDFYLFKNLYTKESTPNFYEDDIKNTIFKVSNFKKKVGTNINIKQNVRQLFFYNTYQFFGSQRFFTEKIISFTLLQHDKKFNFETFYFYLISDSTNNLINNLNNISMFFRNNQIFKHFEMKKIFFGLFLTQTREIFLYFKMSTTLLNFYLFLSQKQDSLINSSISFYKSLILFRLISKKFLSLFKYSFKKNIQRITNFYLKINSLKSNLIIEQNNSKVLQIFFLNFNLTNEIIKNTLKFSFFKFFFDIFLKSKYRDLIVNKLTKKLTKKLKRKLNKFEKKEIYSYSILITKPSCFFMYKLFCFYFNFLIDWKLNFSVILKNFSRKNSRIYDIFLILTDYLLYLNKKWDENLFISFKELHASFYGALEYITLNLKNFFYLNFLLKKNVNLNLKFLISSLFIYISRFTSKDTNDNFFLMSDFVKLSDFFLGKWFYYKQKNHLSNNLFDAHYNIFNPSKISELSQKEIYFHNLSRINFSGNFIFKKLDIYLKKAAKYKTIISADLKKLKLKKYIYKSLKILEKKPVDSRVNWKKFIYDIEKKRPRYSYKLRRRLSVIEDLFTNIINYRTYRWSKKFNESVNNSLEVGFKFNLPELLPSRSFFSHKSLFKKRRYKPDFRLETFSRIKRFRRKKAILRLYKKKSYKQNEIMLTNTFLCIYKNLKLKKTNFYQKILFWFNKLNVN